MDEHAFFERLQATHVAAWNEKDTDKRMALLAEIYAADVTMYDKDNIFYGLQSVSDFIGKLLDEDPAFVFSIVKPLEPLQNSARLFGSIQTSAVLLQSMDFFLIKGGKVQHLYAFLEPAM